MKIIHNYKLPKIIIVNSKVEILIKMVQKYIYTMNNPSFNQLIKVNNNNKCDFYLKNIVFYI